MKHTFIISQLTWSYPGMAYLGPLQVVTKVLPRLVSNMEDVLRLYLLPTLLFLFAGLIPLLLYD
jgi:hypothetical protein